MLPQVVDDCVLMTPLRAKEWSRGRLWQRVTTCLSTSAVPTVLHVLVIPGQPLKVSKVLEEEPEQVERDTTSQKKGS